MKVWRILLVLAAITSIGYSIQCRSCWQFSKEPCVQPLASCSTDQVCVAAYTEVTVGSTVTPQYSMSCGAQSNCNITGSLTFIYGTIRTATSCCSTDNCTAPTPQLPAVNQTKNGLTCRTCYSDTSDYCYTGDTMGCTGDQTKCGRMARQLSGTITLTDAIRGCTTSTFCGILGNQQTTLSGLNINSKMYCSDGTPGLYSGLFYAVTAAFLAKLLF